SQPQSPPAQAPSAGHPSTHGTGGGEVVDPWVSRVSSAASARRSASSPPVDRLGANPSRQTFRQASMAAPPPRGLCRPPRKHLYGASDGNIYGRTLECQQIFCNYVEFFMVLPQ